MNFKYLRNQQCLMGGVIATCVACSIYAKIIHNQHSPEQRAYEHLKSQYDKDVRRNNR